MNAFALATRALPLVLAAALPGAATAQPAADYPTKPVKILVGYAAGGPTDLTARILATKLQLALGQPFVVENKPGAGSNIASELLATSAPDGHTLMVAASQMTWNSALYKNIKYDPIRSFAPVSKIMSSPAILVVSATLPYKTVDDVIAAAKQDPGKLTFASSGSGTVPHLSGELFKISTGVQLTHVPYRGSGAAMNDLMSGQVSMSFITALSAMPFVKDGKLRAIAVVAERRLPQLPSVPTLKEAGVSGVDAETWNGLFAPAGTPPPVIEKLASQVQKILNETEVRKTFEDQAANIIGNSPTDFAASIVRETERSRAFVKATNLTVD